MSIQIVLQPLVLQHFVGRHVTPDDTETTQRATTSSMFQQLMGTTSKIESQYLRPLLVAQERIEKMIKNLFTNQQKIQKTLRKQKVLLILRYDIQIIFSFISR